jgi:hypothetical protein
MTDRNRLARLGGSGPDAHLHRVSLGFFVQADRKCWFAYEFSLSKPEADYLVWRTFDTRDAGNAPRFSKLSLCRNPS